MKKMANKKGNTLISVLIAIGISGILMLGTATMFNNQLKNQQILLQRYDLMDTKNQLLSALSDANVCKCQMALTLVPNGASVFDDALINEIKSSCTATSQTIVKKSDFLAGSSRLKVSDIRLMGFSVVDAATNKYTARVQISFDPQLSTLAFKPILVDQVFRTDAAYKITECSTVGVSSAPAPSTSLSIKSLMCDKAYGRKSNRCCLTLVDGSQVCSTWGDST